MIFSSGDEKTPSCAYVGLEESDLLFPLLISTNLPQRKFIGVRVENSSLPVSKWVAGANMCIIPKRLVLHGFARSHMSGAWRGEKHCWGCWCTEWELCGDVLGAQGAS